MAIDSISFRDTNYFSSLICDYLDEDLKLLLFYNRFPKLENFKAQIKEKQASIAEGSRTVLVESLKTQYKNVNASTLTKKNIEALNSDKTFTITTGHQLNLFTGPLYFLYKIVSTINLTIQLKKEFPECNFVPIYWMATEDHDFDEINYFNFKGKKFQWNINSHGAVGELSTQGLDHVYELFSQELGTGKNADFLRELFTSAYLGHANLTDATRFLANALFSEYGLVIIDAKCSELKRSFIPFIKDELLHETSFNQVSKTNNKLSEEYAIQVNPREINLFYLKDSLRERIIKIDDRYTVNATNISWNESELLEEVDNHPERFSPNVIMRPLYQEVILPNLCYIGGGGELSYWFQLKRFFNKVDVPFPILLLRNSVLIQSNQQSEKLQRLDISSKDIFLKRDELINKKVRKISNIDIDFSSQKEHLQEQFKSLYKLAEQTDKSFLGAVKAQEVKQLKGLSHLEKRLLKAQKRVLSDQVSRMTDLQNELFPNQGLQERNSNFSELYIEYGDQLIHELAVNLKPLKDEFLILNL